MISIRRAILLIAAQKVKAVVYDTLTGDPLSITMEVASDHPDAIISGMNAYFGDTGASEQQFKKEVQFEGITVIEFQNKIGTKGAIALTNDTSKARRAFISLGLMEDTRDKPQKGKPKDKAKPKPKEKEKTKEPPKSKLPVLVVPGLDQDGSEITMAGIKAFLKQVGLPLKVTVEKDGKEYWYTFEGASDPKKFSELQKKIKEYLKEFDYRWEVPRKTSTTGDYSYEKTYL